MTGNNSEANASRTSASIMHKLGTVLLAVTLCLGYAPHASWAQGEEASGSTASAAAAAAASTSASASEAGLPATAPAAPAPSADLGTQAPATPTPTTGDSQAPASTSDGNLAAPLAQQVEATLLVGVHDASGTKMLVNHVLTIDEGSTVEQLLDKAVADGIIDAYAHGTAYPGYTNYYVNSITVAGVAYDQEASFDPYWSSKIDGGNDFTGINETLISHEGFSYQLMLTYASADPDAGITPDPDASHEDLDSSWSGSPQTPAGNVSSATTTPKTPDTAGLLWKNNLLAEGQTYACVSEPLIIDGKIFVAYGTWGALAKLSVFNAATGALISTTPLAAAIESSACRPVYANGIVVIPLVKGQLQGVSAENLKTMWVSAMVSESSQAISGVTVVGDRVFTGTVDTLGTGGSPLSLSGHFMCVDLNNGQVLWSKANASAGYYWSGAALIGSVLVFGDDAGVLHAVDPTTGATVSTLSLGSASIRSSMITDGSGSVGYVVSNDGKLHKISVDGTGVLASAGSVSFAAGSTSTATLFEGNLYVGGMTADYKGVLAVIDAASLALKQSANAPYEIKSTPSVVRGADGATYVYFTCNGADGIWPNYTSGGGVFVYKLGDSAATQLYSGTGSDANWCTKSVVIGPDGTLYWSNDSGNLFAVGMKTADPETPGNPTDPSDGTGAGDNGGASTTQAASKTPASSLAKTGDSLPVSAVGSVVLVALLGALMVCARIRSQRK